MRGEARLLLIGQRVVGQPAGQPPHVVEQELHHIGAAADDPAGADMGPLGRQIRGARRQRLQLLRMAPRQAGLQLRREEAGLGGGKPAAESGELLGIEAGERARLPAVEAEGGHGQQRPAQVGIGIAGPLLVGRVVVAEEAEERLQILQHPARIDAAPIVLGEAGLIDGQIHQREIRHGLGHAHVRHMAAQRAGIGAMQHVIDALAEDLGDRADLERRALVQGQRLAEGIGKGGAAGEDHLPHAAADLRRHESHGDRDIRAGIRQGSGAVIIHPRLDGARQIGGARPAAEQEDRPESGGLQKCAARCHRSIPTAVTDPPLQTSGKGGLLASRTAGIAIHLGLPAWGFAMLLFVLGMSFACGMATFKYISDGFPDNMGVVSGIVGLVGGMRGPAVRHPSRLDRGLFELLHAALRHRLGYPHPVLSHGGSPDGCHRR